MSNQTGVEESFKRAFDLQFLLIKLYIVAPMIPTKKSTSYYNMSITKTLMRLSDPKDGASHVNPRMAIQKNSISCTKTPSIYILVHFIIFKQPLNIVF